MLLKKSGAKIAGFLLITNYLHPVFSLKIYPKNCGLFITAVPAVLRDEWRGLQFLLPTSVRNRIPGRALFPW